MRIAVIGGGITGLTSAYELTKAGHTVRLFEKSNRLGGAIQTTFDGGWLSEGGPNAIQDDGTTVSALIRELGLESARLEAEPTARYRYVLRGGKPVRVPTSPGELLRTPLLPLGARLRIITEMYRGKRTTEPDISVAAFANRHFGPEVLSYAVRPMVAGIYAGDADLLSMRYAFPRIWNLEQRHGSILRGFKAARKEASGAGPSAVPKLISFGYGLQVLTAAMAARLAPGAVELGIEVKELIPGEGWTVAWEVHDEPREEHFDRVVLAVPAPVLAGMTIGLGRERPLQSLAAIPTPPVSSLFLGFRREQVAHPLDGFGVLVPPLEKRRILGVLFSSSIFLGRAPSGHVALTVLAGGALQPQMALRSAPELWQAIRGDLAEVLGVKGEPVRLQLTQWPEAIPQYNLGFEQYLHVLQECEDTHPGLVIGGNTRDGISVPDCIRSGLRLASAAVG